jgi:putative membrane protein
MVTPRHDSRWPLLCLGIGALVLAWSAVRPHDYFTWFLEVLPVLIAVPLLFLLYPRLRFTNLLYGLILLHAIVLIVGGHYTYAEVPLFNWLRDAFHLARNHYDRVGHFMQGFVPAILAREVLVRKSPLKGSRWLPFLVVCVCLAVSACYELFEWAVALATGAASTEFLGTQGDVWDTQWDMFMCLVGATVALLTLSRFHQREIDALAREGGT